MLLLLVAFYTAPLSAAESPFDALKTDLRAEKINRIEKIDRIKVLFFPYLMETAVALNPEMLETTARSGGVVHIGFFDESMRRSLLAALDKIQIRGKLDDYPDLRWGAIFYDLAGRERHSLYLAARMLGSSQHGMIDGTPLTLNSALTDWFEKTFARIMQEDAKRRR